MFQNYIASFGSILKVSNNRFIYCLMIFRIRTERNGGAWCPKNPISKNVYEWIELDLQEMKVVTQVETQGRFGNGQVTSSPSDCGLLWSGDEWSGLIFWSGGVC